MCGIIGYIGKKDASTILLQGLRRLEYRGYDSAGIVCFADKFSIIKSVGKIENLAEKLKFNPVSGNIGIAHTRWATHGGVTEQNAHPHSSCRDEVFLVHNGIIENYRELKKELGFEHNFKSETDSEVLAHLIEKFYNGDIRLAVQKALKKIRGTYGLVVMHKNEPDKMIVARMGSPIVLGVGEGEYFVASDATPLLAHTRDVIFLDDGELAEVSKKGFEIFNLKEQEVQKTIEHIEWNDEQAEKQGYPHFMLKEIFEQPAVFKDAIRGRINEEDGTSHLGGLNMTIEEMHRINRIVLIACGTAYYACMVGKYAFEKLVGIPVEVDVASEFRYRDPIIDKNTLVFAVSQSGETADTLAALREAKRKGAFVRGIVNVVGSTIARETDGGTYIHAGLEFAVASSKAYTNMVAVLLLYALQFGRLNKTSLHQGKEFIEELRQIPQKMDRILEQKEKIRQVAEKYSHYKNFLFLGRGINYPVALEGSLKLKEITYIHSEACPAGEMKHGVNALLSEDFPILAILTKNSLYEKMRSNVEEVKARKSPILLLASEGDFTAQELADDILFTPKTIEILEPLLNTIILQLFAYYTAVKLGRDVDRPRNLAKSVTVE
ncbi:MAG: glutamine--fructose-6-phosphate transaminase (isomerizing) [Candidatus Magasanikbacteria bacterium]|nr:glutamine--fructose-6-phosphate transaminase (isomerizing) [Candidatus Magasanikbacteria bacterium]